MATSPRHECPDCTFAADSSNLLLYFLSRKMRASAGKKPVFVGKFTMPGWVGHSGFYLFKCARIAAMSASTIRTAIAITDASTSSVIGVSWRSFSHPENTEKSISVKMLLLRLLSGKRLRGFGS